jgi:hypothetical protein
VLPPDVNMAMPDALFSSSSSVLVPGSLMLPAAVMSDGSVMLSIWTPSSDCPVTAA